MADQNNAPERIWVRVTDKTVMATKPSDADEFDVEYIRAVAAQPALGYDTDCPECSGTGQRDSGGTHPWGEPAMMMCDCDAPPPAAPTDNTALVEEQRMKEHYRNCWKAQLERANGLEAALASREAPPASDSGEKPLCPVCYNRTDAELRTIGGFYSMESNCPECSPRAKERAKQDADREALVRLLQIITRNGSLDDGRTLHEVIADALLARGLPPPACQQEAVTESDLAAARAEIERLTKERDEAIIKAECWESAARLLEAERDEALAENRFTLGLLDRTMIERDDARSMLADAERDMRQRAAKVCDRNDQVSGWVSRDAILALPLKHADRDNDAAFAQGQKEGE